MRIHPSTALTHTPTSALPRASPASATRSAGQSIGLSQHGGTAIKICYLEELFAQVFSFEEPAQRCGCLLEAAALNVFCRHDHSRSQPVEELFDALIEPVRVFQSNKAFHTRVLYEQGVEVMDAWRMPICCIAGRHGSSEYHTGALRKIRQHGIQDRAPTLS